VAEGDAVVGRCFDGKRRCCYGERLLHERTAVHDYHSMRSINCGCVERVLRLPHFSDDVEGGDSQRGSR
jgi:hypothetical protein